MTEDRRVQLAYMDRKGAGCVRVFPAVDSVIEHRLRTVRAEATLYDPDRSRVIGGVEWCDRNDHDHHRKPGHWIWWFETQEEQS